MSSSAVKIPLDHVILESCGKVVAVDNDIYVHYRVGCSTNMCDIKSLADL